MRHGVNEGAWQRYRLAAQAAGGGLHSVAEVALPPSLL